MALAFAVLSCFFHAPAANAFENIRFSRTAETCSPGQLMDNEPASEHESDQGSRAGHDAPPASSPIVELSDTTRHPVEVRVRRCIAATEPGDDRTFDAGKPVRAGPSS